MLTEQQGIAKERVGSESDSRKNTLYNVSLLASMALHWTIAFLGPHLVEWGEALDTRPEVAGSQQQIRRLLKLNILLLILAHIKLNGWSGVEGDHGVSGRPG